MIRDITGKIEVITDIKSKEINWKKGGEEKTATLFECGVKLVDGTWHNVEKNSEAKVKEVLTITDEEFDRCFEVGDNIKIYEEDKKGKGFYKVTSMTHLPEQTELKREVKEEEVKEVSEKSHTPQKEQTTQRAIDSVKKYKYSFDNKEDHMMRMSALKGALMQLDIEQRAFPEEFQEPGDIEKRRGVIYNEILAEIKGEK